MSPRLHTRRALASTLVLTSLIVVPAGIAAAGPPSPRASSATLAVACNPPIPQSGQVVVWTAAMNPVQICQNTTIPAGAEVQLAPGTQLEVLSGVTLTVDGFLNGLGTAGSPLNLTGDGQVLVRNLATIDHAHVDLDFAWGSRATIELRNATVAQGSDISTFQRDGVLVLENVVVQSGQPTQWSQLAMRNVTLANPSPFLTWSCYFLAEDVVVHGQGLSISADHQPRVLSNVDVVNPGAVPALTVGGGGTYPGTNVLIEETCDLVGGTFPVNLRVGGLHPDSVLPLTGNQRNAIDIGDAGAGSGVCDWPNLGLPYYAALDASVQGRPRVGPGAIFEFEQFAGLEIRGNFFDDTGIFRGTPEFPVLVRPATNGAEHAGVALFNSTAQHLDVDGGRISSISGLNEIAECRVHDSPLGIHLDHSGTVRIRGCTIESNSVGVEDDLSSSTVVDMSGYDRPNILRNNGIAAINNAEVTSSSVGPFPAQMNWWGDASGPQSQWINPAGQGDPIGFGVEAAPWRTVMPDLSDTPPFVTVAWPFLLAEPGDTIYVHWSAEDDGQIVSQRILMDISGGGNPNWVVLQSGLDPDQRDAFVEVPFIGWNADARSAIFRVEATDDAGYVGKHDITLQVPVLHRPDGTVQFTTDTTAGYVPGEEAPVCYSAIGMAGNMGTYLVMDTEENTLFKGPSGSPGLNTCTFSSLRFPLISTDRARFAIFADGQGNDNDWYFSEPFTVRPLSTFPDAPPQITMLSPVAAQRFSGGSTVPITWQASDDEGLREFRVQVSLNDGRTWSSVATVPGNATSFDWQLPEVSTTIEDVRVRVVAVDHRFQVTTDGDQLAIALDPAAPLTTFCFGDGSGAPCPCANSSALGAGEGCVNSTGRGAELSVTGSDEVANDNVVLHVAQARPSQPGVFIQGRTKIEVPFRDGLLCMGNPTERVEFVFADAAGATESTVSLVTAGTIAPGDTVHYQFWYRDPALSPCGTGSNLSSAGTLHWK